MRFTKYILPTLVIVMVGLVAFSATTINWSGPQQTGTLSYSGLVVTNSTLGATNEMAVGGIDSSGDLASAGTFTLDGTALNVTNDQVITVSAGTYILNGIGSPDDTTNAVTLVAPAAAGQIVTFIMATATSNLVSIADSGTIAATGALVLDANDTAVFQAVDTSTWCEIGTSDN